MKSYKSMITRRARMVWIPTRGMTGHAGQPSDVEPKETKEMIWQSIRP